MKKHIGNLLILFSFLLLTYIYYPFLTAYLPQNTPLQAANGQDLISIPKIKATAPIVEDVDPWDKGSYEKALKHGVAQAKGFSKPGEKGLVFLFAHSSLPPWQMTRINTAFLRLGELQEGDKIEIKQSFSTGKNYIVFAKKELWPNQTEVFQEDKDKDELILQTCSPVGTDLKRLLIFAKPI